MLQQIPAMLVFREEMAESGEDGAVCVTSHQALASSQLKLGIGHIFPDPESELEVPAKACREKRTSEHRVSVSFLLTHRLQ